jgi:hypothetical protein
MSTFNSTTTSSLGSFELNVASVGEYYSAVNVVTNNITNIYLVGYANGVEVTQTTPYDSPDQGAGYEINYAIDYSPFNGKRIDSFRVYYTAEQGTKQSAFNLVDFTISSASTTPPAPAAPNVSADDAANVILGLDTTMEFQVDGGAYVKYNGSNAPDLTGTHIVKVRVPADTVTGTPAGAETTLTFTPNPAAPAAPNVSADDAANVILGLDATMEFQVDGGSYVKYDGSNAPDLTGTHTVKVRVPVDTVTGTPAGAETTLTFTPNPAAPSTPTPTPAATATSTPAATATQVIAVEVLVNGEVEIAGTDTTSTRSNQTVLTIVLDEQKLEQKLAAEDQNAVITIPVNTKSDVVIGELNGRMLQSMEQKQAVIEIRTDKATYTIPAQQINISSIAQQLGQSVALQDISIQLEIATPTLSTLNLVASSAQKDGFSIVVPAINFIVRAVYREQMIEITKFNVYVERTLAVPDGVDPNRITTGVVVEPDGEVRHVPTKIIMIDGQYFAQINSLTNSTYSVVYPR